VKGLKPEGRMEGCRRRWRHYSHNLMCVSSVDVGPVTYRVSLLDSSVIMIPGCVLERDESIELGVRVGVSLVCECDMGRHRCVCVFWKEVLCTCYTCGSV